MQRLLALLCLLAFVFLPPAAQARLAPYVAISPSSPHVGDRMTFAGCGYGAGKDISLFLESPTMPETYEFTTRIDAGGCFDSSPFASYPADVAGTWSVYVYPKTGSGVGTYGHHRPLIDVDFQVVP